MARKISTRRENHTDNSHNAAVPRVNAVLSRENGGHWMPRERELFVVLRIRARGKKCKVILFFRFFFFLTKIQAVTLRLLALHLAFQVRNRLESFLYGKLLQLVFLRIDFIASEITI